MKYKKNKNTKGNTEFSHFIDEIKNNNLSITHLPRFLFICFLFILYIFFNHTADRLVSDIKNLKNEVGNLKAEYRTIHSKYRNSRLQSSIAKSVKSLGIIENETPPLKIKLQVSENK